MITIPTSQAQETLLEAFGALKKLLAEESMKHLMRLQIESTTNEQLRFSSGFSRGMAYALRLLEMGEQQALKGNQVSFLLEDEPTKEADITVSASV